jgi:hypothetical protein
VDKNSLAATIRTFIPFGDLPRHPDNPSSCSVKWMLTDSEEVYRKHSGHPVYNIDDITYDFNSYGYRCPEFRTDPDIRVLSVGCSYVLGLGLPARDIFHERLCRRIAAAASATICNWNLGSGGASNDLISRLVHLAVPYLAPDLVLVNFTHSGRRDYVSVEGQHFNYLPALQRLFDFLPYVQRLGMVEKEIHSHFAALTSVYDDALNLYRNYSSLAALLKGTPWLCSFSSVEQTAILGDHLQKSHLAGIMPRLDLARDHLHPGPISHERLEMAYWTKLTENRWLETITDRKGMVSNSDGRGLN